jgi:hypothetical protein
MAQIRWHSCIHSATGWWAALPGAARMDPTGCSLPLGSPRQGQTRERQIEPDWEELWEAPELRKSAHIGLEGHGSFPVN